METIRICKQCRKPLPQNAPEGLCPECLARVALGSEPATPGTRVPPAPADLAAQFPQLEILELLGMGGMGMVYKARQPRLDRLVALKILPIDSMPDASFAERFEREARALAKLNHPGIVTLHDFGQTREYYYFIMEYVDGMNLRQLIQAKTMEPRQALELVTQICTALQFAHDEKIVHRDIKPENILITKKGQVKIADFGLVKLLGGKPDTALTASQMVMGTMNYMAPEQRENTKNVDHRADIYSLGVVFYEMLTGEVPMGRFEAPSKKVQVDVRLDEVVLHALEREPARRYQHVSEVKSNVETITSSMPRRTNTTGTSEAFKPQPPPGFVSYVFKRFAICILVWLGIGLCLRWALGDRALNTDPHSSIPMQIISTIFIIACGLFGDLGMAKFILPAVFVFVLYAWLEAREKRGLLFRQLPPKIQRRFGLWTVVTVGSYFAALLATVPGWFFAPLRHEQTREWWFVPIAGGYEKLGLRATFSAVEQHGKTYYEAPQTCTISLIVHRKDKEPSVMEVALPSLRTKYRIPATNSWDYTSVLDKDTLVDWLRKGAGLDIAAPKFKEQADEVYNLLRLYQDAPPNTGEEFMNAAKVQLSDFGFGGFTDSGSWEAGGGGWFNYFVVISIETTIYIAFSFWANRRLHRAAWAEIESGRWTPPTVAPKRFFTASSDMISVAVFLLAVYAAYLAGQFVPLLGGLLFLAILLIATFQLSSRRQIHQARENGLWPQPGEVPTLEHVKGLAQAGERILAIKLYRQIHPVSLVEAKAAVEKLAGH